MKDTLNQILTSKRAWVALVASIVALASWKSGASFKETADRIELILGILGAAYGLENIATAIPMPPKGMKLVPLLTVSQSAPPPAVENIMQLTESKP